MRNPPVRILVAAITAAIVFLTLASAAFATSCYVANKQPGAGTEGVFFTLGGIDRFSIEIPCPAQVNGSPTNGMQNGFDVCP